MFFAFFPSNEKWTKVLCCCDPFNSFSEHGYAAYQIKWNHECSNMAEYSWAQNPHDPGERGQNSTFRNMAMLHIKLKGITNAATWYQICCPQPHPPPLRPWMSKDQI